jgi:hypothetical protein
MRGFDQKDYNKWDNTAKKALVRVLQQEGHEIQRVSENFYADVESKKDGETIYSEAEVKTAWSKDWPNNWSEIRIPGRKKRLLKKYNNKVTFYVFRKDLKQVWRIKGEQLKDSNLKSAFGKNISHGEKFFHIPYQEAELVKVPDEL